MTQRCLFRARFDRDDKGAGNKKREDTFLLNLNVHLAIPFYSHLELNFQEICFQYLHSECQRIQVYKHSDRCSAQGQERKRHSYDRDFGMAKVRETKKYTSKYNGFLDRNL